MKQQRTEVQTLEQYMELVRLLIVSKAKDAFNGQVTIVFQEGQIKQVRDFTIYGSSNLDPSMLKDIQ